MSEACKCGIVRSDCPYHMDDGVLAAVPNFLKTQLGLSAEPGEAFAPSFNLRLYTILLAVIDGQLQAEEQSVDVRIGPDKRRVLIRWAVPQSGFEWDGRPYVGTDRTARVAVVGPCGDVVLQEDMRCIWFAVSHGVNSQSRARAIFECAPANARH